MAYRATPHTALGISPAEALTGEEIALPADSDYRTRFVENQARLKALRRLRIEVDLAKAEKGAATRLKLQRAPLIKGDWVLCLLRPGQAKLERGMWGSKLAPKWTRPAKILEIYGVKTSHEWCLRRSAELPGQPQSNDASTDGGYAPRRRSDVGADVTGVSTDK